MILDSMTIEEVGKCLLRTAQQNYLRFGLLMAHKNNKYRRFIIKRGQERYDFKPINVQVENITFHICPYSLSKLDFKKFGLSFCLLASFTYQNRKRYCMFTNLCLSVQIYTKHFFERYIERHLKDDSKVDFNLIRHYFKEIDYVLNPEAVKKEGYENAIYAGTKIGTCLGYKACDNVYVFKTYIDKETVRGEKRKVFNESQPLLQPIGMDCLGNRIYPTGMLERLFSESATNSNDDNG